jgi:hypothetical protein
MEALKYGQPITVTEMEVGKKYPGRFMFCLVHYNTFTMGGHGLLVDTEDLYGNSIRLELRNSPIDEATKRSFLLIRNPQLKEKEIVDDRDHWVVATSQKKDVVGPIDPRSSLLKTGLWHPPTQPALAPYGTRICVDEMKPGRTYTDRFLLVRVNVFSMSGDELSFQVSSLTRGTCVTALVVALIRRLTTHTAPPSACVCPSASSTPTSTTCTTSHGWWYATRAAWRVPKGKGY